MKYKELKVKAYLTQEFRGVFTHNARIWLGDCSSPFSRFLDFYVMIGDTLVIIEVDEHQHKGEQYSDENEQQRNAEILHNIGLDKKLVFIRFNPDSYRVDGKLKKTPFVNRLFALRDVVNEVLTYLGTGEEYESVYHEFKLFFDNTV